jgi:hypothetical protein
VFPPELDPSFGVRAKDAPAKPAMVVAASSPIQKQATPCQSCGLKALTNLRCSRWSALPPQPEPACAACRQTHQTSQPSPCHGSKLVNYCSQECQLRGAPAAAATILTR